MPKKDEGVGKLKLIKGANSVDDVLIGTDEDEPIRSFGGDDMLAGDGENYVVEGSSGNDRLDGGSGDDIVLGDTGDDRAIYVSADAIDIRSRPSWKVLAIISQAHFRLISCDLSSQNEKS